MAAYTKETLMAKITSKYPDIVDVELVKTTEKTTVTYNCGHSDTVLLNSLLSRGSKSVCRTCNPAKTAKKTPKQFLEEVAQLTSDLEFLEEYTGAKTPISFKYKSCSHINKASPQHLLSLGTGLICRICNPAAPASKKSNAQFLEEVAKLTSDIEFLEEYKGRDTPLSFRYNTCGHTHKVRPNDLLRQGNSLICRICDPIKKTNEQFSKEVAKLTSNIEFLEEYKGRGTPLSFRYKTCGHISTIRPGNLFSRGSGLICRTCDPANSKSNEEFLEEVTKLTLDIEFLEEYLDNKTPLSFRYKSCSHEHKVSPSNLLSKGTGLICRICNPLSTSKGERVIAELLSKYTEVETNNRAILEGLEIDIYLPEFKIGIEYNGEYWHSAKHKDKHYHLDKTKLAEKQGIRLIQVFEHEWLQKQEIVKSRLLGMLQQNYKLGARKCIIRELTFSNVRGFLNDNHLQGAGSPSKHNLGLYYKDILVAVMTFSKPRLNGNYDYELIRYASLTGVNVQGATSKLLKYFTNNYQGSVISYSDKRWSQGNLYKTIGFKFSHTANPGYFYAKNNDILSRYKCQKHRLKELLPDFYKDELTEYQIMTAAGYCKVYDCGSDVWIFK